MNADAQLLETTWHRDIPLAAAMQLRVADYTGERLTTTAPLSPNVNLHGTAFAGSLYSICALTGWGYVWRLARTAGIDGNIVLSRGEIHYLHPVTGPIDCAAMASGPDRAAFETAIGNGRAGRCRVECEILSPDGPAARFSGYYHMRQPDCAATGA